MLGLKKNKSSKEQSELQETKNWYADRFQYVIVQRNILAFITFLSLAGIVLTTAVLAWMMPLKTIEPFVIQVEEKTGITQLIDPMEIKDLNANKALKSYFVAKYIKARESYDMSRLQESFELVRLMSTKQVHDQFKYIYSPTNPENPVNLLQHQGTRKVKIKSLTFLEPMTAQVRLLVTEYERDQTPTKQWHKIALVKFEFVKLNLQYEERYINPLGFRVTYYSIDEEVVQQ